MGLSHSQNDKNLDLISGVTCNDSKKVKLALEKGANPNTEYYSSYVLNYSISHGYTEIVRLLVEYRADINTENYFQTVKKFEKLQS